MTAPYRPDDVYLTLVWKDIRDKFSISDLHRFLSQADNLVQIAYEIVPLIGPVYLYPDSGERPTFNDALDVRVERFTYNSSPWLDLAISAGKGVGSGVSLAGLLKGLDLVLNKYFDLKSKKSSLTVQEAEDAVRVAEAIQKKAEIERRMLNDLNQEMEGASLISMDANAIGSAAMTGPHQLQAIFASQLQARTPPAKSRDLHAQRLDPGRGMDGLA